MINPLGIIEWIELIAVFGIFFTLGVAFAKLIEGKK